MSQNRNLSCLAAGVLAILFNASLLPAGGAPLAGTRAIGPTGDYASITAAIADAKAQTLGGPLVWELQSNYVCTVETFPLVFGNLTNTSGNTLTLRPHWARRTGHHERGHLCADGGFEWRAVFDH